VRVPLADLVCSALSSRTLCSQDPRQKKSAVAPMQLHKKGNKVACMGVHPLEQRLVATGSNDHSVRLLVFKRAKYSSVVQVA